ncbi:MULTISPECIES: MAPEG family protein [Pseudomonas]|uniref:MAPEG family protein n=1 Tax=Pseudomonas TaxID=286 RepID=UPI00159D88F8|nr:MULTISPECIES: MAPEG family protein [Pseudomonas]WHH49880.1 MAPEG family protein [Pseudomonas sp. Ap32]MBP2271945.1 putative MAPEG superfamily protein [Pseudomonas sp. BP6]MBP2289084.1 putative MAPEG superfamily protein [Pseudomonas sp. BP7]NVN63452.1 MAPEG family protein [Pseudomonas putida]NVN69268.1 MAPEG family protein [Pseudomonas putida]
MSGALQVYALCVVVLSLKMFLVSCYQGYHRLRFVAFTNPEDAAVFRRVAQAVERPQVIRAAKVWANDLENIPMFFALGGLAVALEAATLPVLWLSTVFTVARVLHTLAYLRGLQPWRTLFYGIGVICLLGFCSLIAAKIGD